MLDHKFKKKYGQNFLMDKNILNKICESISPNKNDLIIEIGPGSGNLTKRLKDLLETKVDEKFYLKDEIVNRFVFKDSTLISTDNKQTNQIIQIGTLLGNYGLALIVACLIIRLLLYPVTKKTAMQSELIKKAQPELDRLTKKYKDKTDTESMMRQQQEMMAIYKKYNINPMAGCLFSFLQLPLFIAFFEAVQRTPAIFEDKFLSLQLGTTPSVGIISSSWLAYGILIILIGGTTYYSLKMNSSANMTDPTMKMMPTMMTVMLLITGIFMPSGLGIYWVTSNAFTIVQNIMVKRSKEVNGKA